MVDLTSVYKTTKYLVDGGEVINEHREYLGMSQMGHECPRYLWYSFRWYYVDKVTPRVLRLWQRGHREEPEVFKILESIGYKVDDTQQDMECSLGHVRGHNDGTVFDVIEAPKTEHLIEVKTMNDKYFKLLLKDKLFKSNEKYYAQIQMYLHHLKLTRALFVAVNKNDDTLYFERVEYARRYAEELVIKANYIVMTDTVPDRAFSTPTFYQCKWCAAKDICWNDAKPEKNCRTCKHSTIAPEGKWICNAPGFVSIQIPIPVQRTGCGNYER